MAKRPTKRFWQAYGALYGISDAHSSLVNKEEKKPNQEAKIKPKPRKGRRTYPERDLVHLPIMHWATTHPICSEHLFHIENERKCTPQQGYMRRIMGVKPGVSDLFLAYPRGKYAGFWLELKAPGKKPTETQRTWLIRMAKAGYAAAWFDNAEKAIRALEAYCST